MQVWAAGESVVGRGRGSAREASLVFVPERGLVQASAWGPGPEAASPGRQRGLEPEPEQELASEREWGRVPVSESASARVSEAGRGPESASEPEAARAAGAAWERVPAGGPERARASEWGSPRAPGWESGRGSVPGPEWECRRSDLSSTRTGHCPDR